MSHEWKCSYLRENSAEFRILVMHRVVDFVFSLSCLSLWSQIRVLQKTITKFRVMGQNFEGM